MSFTMYLQYMYEFIEVCILRQTSPEEAFNRLEDMSQQQTENLRKLTKAVQEARQDQNDEAVKIAVNDYDDAMEQYVGEHIKLQLHI